MFGLIIDIIKSRIFVSVFSFLIVGFLIASSLGLGAQFTAGVSAFVTEHMPWIKPFLQSITSFLSGVASSEPPK